MRIVSLLPAATEIVAALGLDDQLVGVTFECDAPPGIAEGREILVHGLDLAGRPAGEIDEVVRAAAASGGPMYRLDEAAFSRCRPDLVLTQDLCRVCALPAGDAEDALEHLGCRAEVVCLDPHRLDEVLHCIAAVARAAGIEERGEALVASLRRRLDQVAAALAGRPRRRTFVLEWTDPPFLAGHWVPDVVRAAGGDPVLCVPGGRSTETDWAAIAAAEPEVIVVGPCGFGLDGAAEQAAAVAARLPPSAEVWAIDANGYTVRAGPRLVDTVEQLAAALNPGLGVPREDVLRRLP